MTMHFLEFTSTDNGVEISPISDIYDYNRYWRHKDSGHKVDDRVKSVHIFQSEFGDSDYEITGTFSLIYNYYLRFYFITNLWAIRFSLVYNVVDYTISLHYIIL